MIIDPDFPDHWQTKMLIGLLGGDQAAPVYVIRLWAHCQNRRKWIFDDLPAEALKALCCFPGNANKLESSLAASDFVRRVGKKITIIKWDVYNKSLIASWENGKKGGRNPRDTHGVPNPSYLFLSSLVFINPYEMYNTKKVKDKFLEWFNWRETSEWGPDYQPEVTVMKSLPCAKDADHLMKAIDNSIRCKHKNICFEAIKTGEESTAAKMDKIKAEFLAKAKK